MSFRPRSGRTTVALSLALLLGAAVQALASAAEPLSPPVGGPAAVSTGDLMLQPLRDKWGDDSTGESAKARQETGSWKENNDLGSAFTIEKQTGAQDVWGMAAPGGGHKLTGYGVGVALIDTGVMPVEGLKVPGKVVYGPDLSLESQATSTRYLDGYGHGTHMAALIAGRDSNVKAGEEKNDKVFVGMAPDATLVSVKVGAGDGGVDVSQVIAAIDWVVANRAANNVRVLNLSYGVDTLQSPGIDPLALAVENAWRAGIVVVAAAGNGGETGASTLTMPAVDPFVIAVGSSDHNGSDKAANWRVGSWTNPGTSSRRPDLLAPGKSVVSLRVPGSVADTTSPQGRVTGEAAGRMFRGTGTSQSAAIVSGAAALLLQRNPTLTPDQVKNLLRTSAVRLPNDTNPAQGAGVLNVKGAVDLLVKGTNPAANQTWTHSTGTGSLQAARGSSQLVDPLDGAILTGEVDMFGKAWNATAWAASSTAGTAWSGGSWRGSLWTGDGWTTDAFLGRMWAGRMWAGASWTGRMWAGRLWAGGSWTGSTWTADGWSGRMWAGACWSGRMWASNDHW